MKTFLLLVVLIPMSAFGQLYKGDSLEVNVEASVNILDGNILRDLLNTLPKHYPNPRAVVLNVEGKIFRYDYLVQNLKSSRMGMEEFTVYILDSKGANNYTIPRTIDPKHWEFPNIGVARNHVGLVSWIVDRDTTDVFDMDIFTPGKWALQPGNTLSFGLLSKEPPGIDKFQAVTFIRPNTSDETDSLMALGYTREQVMPPWDSLGFKGFTLSPKTPPSPFEGISWIDTLISYKHQSIALGWLKDDKTHKQDCDEMMSGRDWYRRGEFGKFRSWEPDESWEFDHDWNSGIVRVLDRRLDKAKSELTRGDSVRARRDLEILVIEVEMLNNLSKKLEGRDKKSEVRDKNPIMTSEAYALLKYNAEYLIDRLPEGQGREGREKR